MIDHDEIYTNVSDEGLIYMIRNGEARAQDFILHKYKDLVKIKARTYFLIGADKEDIIQEGMIGLYKAIRDYKPDKEASFRVFAEMCITRQIITAIKAATRQKHIPLNSYLSLNKTAFDEESGQTYMDVLSGDPGSNPEDLFISREDMDYIENNMGKVLSNLESQVLSLYLQGKSYGEIASLTSNNVKSIDNALQRVKRKVGKLVDKKRLDA